jgi:hypothetical protein
MSKIEIKATKSGVQVSADGIVALAIGLAIAAGGLVATMHYFPVW